MNMLRGQHENHTHTCSALQAGLAVSVNVAGGGLAPVRFTDKNFGQVRVLLSNRGFLLTKLRYISIVLRYVVRLILVAYVGLEYRYEMVY